LIVGVFEKFGEDGSGSAEKDLITVRGGRVMLDAGIGKHPAIILVESFPSPKGFAVDLKALGDLGVGVPSHGQFDGSELAFGKLADLGKIPVVPKCPLTPPGGGTFIVGEGL